MDRAFLAELTEAVEALDSPVTLVLDDVHEVSGSGTLAGLTDFLRNLPDRLNLIIGSRRDPAIPLHRLRLEGRLREVRGSDLAFGRDEVGQVLHGQGLHLDETDVTTLWRRTEGWPAAVRLAALALAQEPDPKAFVADFAGDDTAVAGYLVAEILSRQPDTLQQFLLDTCVADELTARPDSPGPVGADQRAVQMPGKGHGGRGGRLGKPAGGTTGRAPPGRPHGFWNPTATADWYGPNRTPGERPANGQ